MRARVFDPHRLRVTPTHPFWSKGRGWTDAQSLATGERVLALESRWLRGGGSTWVQQRETVYNFEVENFHTYFAGDLRAWVHNEGCGPEVTFSELLAKARAAARRHSTRLVEISNICGAACSNPLTRFPEYVADLSHVTGRTTRVRNTWIAGTIRRYFPNLRFTFEPKYNPFLKASGVAKPFTGTQIGRSALYSQRSLIDTIVHEELHHRWFKRGILVDPHDDPVLDERFLKRVARYMRMREL